MQLSRKSVPPDQIRSLSDAMSSLFCEFRSLERSEVADGVGAAGIRALYEITWQGVRTSAELASALEIDKSAASRLIASLVRAGLIQVGVDARDKRQKPILPTKRGHDLIEEANRQRSAIAESVLALLSRTERGILEEGVSLFARSLKKVRLQQSYDVRPIRRGDNAQVTQLIRRVMIEYGFDGQEYFAYPEEFSSPYEAFQRPRSTYYVAIRDDKIVGAAGIAELTDAPKGICELRKLFVLPEARQAGLGTRLLETCLERARELGYRRCYVETTGRMALGKNLYEKCGFRRIRQRYGPALWKACDEWYITDL